MKKNISSIKLTIIIPVYNEKNTITSLLDKIESQIHIKKQIILVDDYSLDNSLKLIEQYDFKSEFIIIKHQSNKGKGASIKSSISKITGDIVLIQDADLEYDPEDYSALVEPIINGKTKVVYGSRFKKSDKRQRSFHSSFRILINFVLTFFSNIINSQKLTDAHTCYKVFDKNLFMSLKLNENGFSFCPEVTTKLGKINEKIFEIPINYTGRSFDQGKKISFYDGIEAILTIFKYKYFKN